MCSMCLKKGISLILKATPSNTEGGLFVYILTIENQFFKLTKYKNDLV